MAIRIVCDFTSRGIACGNSATYLITANSEPTMDRAYLAKHSCTQHIDEILQECLNETYPEVKITLVKQEG